MAALALTLASCNRSQDRGIAEQYDRQRLQNLARLAAQTVVSQVDGERKNRLELATGFEGIDDATKIGLAVRIFDRRRDRGCLSLWHGVADAEAAVISIARHAAEDPRYPRLERRELPVLSVEISVYGEFGEIRGPFDFRPGRDTLMVINEGDPTLMQAGIFGDKIKTKEGYVDAILAKAGLPADAKARRDLQWLAAPTVRIVLPLLEAARQNQVPGTETRNQKK